jgi:hypothetical protein
MARDVIFLDGFADNLFANSVRVYIGSIPGIEAFVVCSFE